MTELDLKPIGCSRYGRAATGPKDVQTLFTDTHHGLYETGNKKSMHPSDYLLFLPSLLQTQTSCDTSSWRRWRWARAVSKCGKATKRLWVKLRPFLCSFGHPLHWSLLPFLSPPLVPWTTRTPVLCPLVKTDCFWHTCPVTLPPSSESSLSL